MKDECEIRAALYRDKIYVIVTAPVSPVIMQGASV